MRKRIKSGLALGLVAAMMLGTILGQTDSLIVSAQEEDADLLNAEETMSEVSEEETVVEIEAQEDEADSEADTEEDVSTEADSEDSTEPVAVDKDVTEKDSAEEITIEEDLIDTEQEYEENGHFEEETEESKLRETYESAVDEIGTEESDKLDDAGSGSVEALTQVSEDRILVDGRYYYKSRDNSNYAYDNTKYTSDALTVNIKGDYSRTPGFLDTYGRESVETYIKVYPSMTTTSLVNSWFYIENGRFETDLDLSDLEEGEYDLYIYPWNSSSGSMCAVTSTGLYIKNNEVYFGQDYGGIQASSVEKMQDIHKKLNEADPDAILKNYINSEEATEYGAVPNGKYYNIAHTITTGIADKYEIAKKIYDYVGRTHEKSSTEDIQAVARALMGSMEISTISVDGGYQKWMWFYANGDWHAFSPDAVIYDNNIGYFDSQDNMIIWTLMGNVQLVTEFKQIESDEPEVEVSTNPVHFNGTYKRSSAFEVLKKVNAARKKEGLSELKMNQGLLEAAEQRACEINVYYSHTRPNRKGFSSILPQNIANGENIAYGYSSPDKVFTAWMDSEGHRKNILKEDYKSIGIACFTQGRRLSWVQLFSRSELEEMNSGYDYDGVKTVDICNDFVRLEFQDRNLDLTKGNAKKQNPVMMDNVMIDNNSYAVPEINDVQFYGYDEKVVKIDSTGDFVPQSVGKTTVKAKIGYQTANCIVTVHSAQKKQSISTSDNTYIKIIGDKPFNLGAKAKTALSYSSSNKKAAKIDKNGKVSVNNIGTAKISITAKETSDYKKATKVVTVKVSRIPGTKLSKVSSKAGKLIISWKNVKVSSGYEVQYSKTKSFTKSTTKTVSIKSGKRISYTIKKLKNGKNYYVRVRVYRKAGNKIYKSSWSGIKKASIR